MRNSRIFLASFGLISSLSVLACGAKDEPAAPACNKFDYANYSGGATGLTFAKDIEPIVKVRARSPRLATGRMQLAPPSTSPSSARSGTADPMELMKNRAAIVGVAALEAPALQYVKAGDPENSWLMKKVEGVQACTGVACMKIADAPTPCGEAMPMGPRRFRPLSSRRFAIGSRAAPCKTSVHDDAADRCGRLKRRRAGR